MNKYIVLCGLLATSVASAKTGASVVVQGTFRQFAVSQTPTDKPQYQATFGYDAPSFGAALQSALGNQASLKVGPTGSILVWSHVPIVGKNGVAYRNIKLAPATGNGGSSSVQSTTLLKPLNAKNSSAAVSDGISFFSKATNGTTVWYQSYDNNTKPSQP